MNNHTNIHASEKHSLSLSLFVVSLPCRTKLKSYGSKYELNLIIRFAKNQFNFTFEVLSPKLIVSSSARLGKDLKTRDNIFTVKV